jgi:hypothetical protein
VTRTYASLLASAAALSCLMGCGGGEDGDRNGPPAVVTHILSDSRFDGDIEETAPNSYVVTQGMSASVQSVLAGIDPTTQTEFRAFLDFPLGGTGGIPSDARIDSAFLEFYVDNLLPASGSLPVRVELVAFQPPNLIGTDFDRAIQPQISAVLVSGDVNRNDIGNFVDVDVTPLLVEAQRQGLVDFQVRVLEDLGPAIDVLMEIDDTTGPARSQRGPVLTVTYR